MYKRVLVPLDGSKLAEEIVPLAERVSRGCNIPLHLLTVIQQDSVAGPAALPAVEDAHSEGNHHAL